MPNVHDLPEHVLHEIIFVTINSVRFRGWPLSLRLVNHDFNEAVLHVYYLRRKFRNSHRAHSLDCSGPCDDYFCTMHLGFELKETYGARFIFQTFLATQAKTSKSEHFNQLLRQWTAALETLRAVEFLKRLGPHQIRFYSTCSDSPIFNDIPSAILSHAVSSYPGGTFHHISATIQWYFYNFGRWQAYIPSFWVVLSACVLGDLQLFEAYIDDLPPVEKSLDKNTWENSVTMQPVALLKVAIQHNHIQLVRLLLEKYQDLMPQIHTSYEPLQAAIFCDSTEILEAVLAYTPNEPQILINALMWHRCLLNRSDNGSEVIRILTRHFSPLSGKARTWLIFHSSAVSDVTLLEEFSRMGPLLSDRIFDAGGRTPTYAHIAIRCGNAKSLRFLLDHEALQSREAMNMATEKALSYGSIECYRELCWHFSKRGSYEDLCQRVDVPQSLVYFQYLGLADNAEEIISEIMLKSRSLIFTLWEPEKPTIGQKALRNSIHRLKSENVQLLLSSGVCAFPWTKKDDPFEIPWPYFSQNRTAFLDTQKILEAYDLPGLRVLF